MSILLEDNYDSRFHSNNLPKSEKREGEIKERPVLTFLEKVVAVLDAIAFPFK
jgi:hypothetical protein